MSRFFLDRPVFAWVIAIAMILGAGLAIYNLPIFQYSRIAPPSIAITATYPGATAKTVEDSVVQIIEQKMTGLDRLLYISSTSDSSGQGALTLTFAPGVDPDLAWSKAQNKLQLAKPMLPEVVQRQGVTVSKSTRNYLMLVSLISENATIDQNDLTDRLAGSAGFRIWRPGCWPGRCETTRAGANPSIRLPWPRKATPSWLGSTATRWSSNGPWLVA